MAEFSRRTLLKAAAAGSAAAVAGAATAEQAHAPMERGLKSGDVVLVKSAQGAALAGVIVTDRIRPQVVAMHHGAWFNPMKTPKGRIDVHGNSNTLTPDIPTSKLARGNNANTGMVLISKWAEELPPVTCFQQPVYKL